MEDGEKAGLGLILKLRIFVVGDWGKVTGGLSLKILGVTARGSRVTGV